MEPQLADLALEVAGVWLAECFGTLGAQADKEVDPAEIPIREAFQPGPHLRLDLDLLQVSHAVDDLTLRR